jgi:vitamin B12 transporter
MRLSFRFVLPFALLLAILSPATCSAQTSATIRGTLTDPTGAVISGAAVDLRSGGASNSAVHTESAGDGTFSAVVSAGTYRLSMAAPGFLTVEREVSLTAGAVETIDARMELAPMSANVIISAEAEPQPAAEVVSRVDVLTREDIEQEQQVWLTPMLATVAGVAFSQLGPEGGVVSLFLDGGNSNYTRVLIDGVPEDVSLAGISIDLSGYTTDSVDKIEVVHGASSALYGSDAMTGVIDVVTHRGTATTPQLILGADGGTFGTARGGGQLSGILGRFDYSVGAGYFTTRGQSPGTYVLENYGSGTYPYFRDTTLSGNFGWKFSETNTLRLTLRNGTSDGGQQGQSLLAAQSPFAMNPGAHGALHDFSSGLAWDFATGKHWQTHVQGFDSRYQDALDEPYFEYFAVNKFNRAGLDARTTYSFGRGSVTAGYYFENETGGVLGRHDNAGYIEARYSFTRRLTAIAGGRVEANDSYGTRFVPRAGLAYALRYGDAFWGATELRASYGEGIKEPPLFPQGCTPILKPEQSATFDVGIDQAFDSNRVKVSATYFHNDFRDIVSFESTGDEETQNCPAFGGDYFNTDKARAYGADSSIRVKAARWLDVGGTYAYDNSKVLDSPNASDPALVAGNRLLKRPLNAANLFFNAHFRGMNWNVTGYYVGRRTDSDFLGLGLTSDPGYVRWDTSAIVPLRHGLSFTAHIDNLFDKHYSDAIGYPALGYNYRVGIRYVWGGER